MTHYFIQGKQQKELLEDLSRETTYSSEDTPSSKENIVDRWFGFLKPGREERTEEPAPAGDALQDAAPAIQHDITDLAGRNEDCIGWVTVPGTGIDYPVMWTPREPQKYLKLNFQGEYSDYGVPFLDARCTTDSGNLILYGHNMFDGSMFTPLIHFDHEDFGRTFRLELNGEAREYEVIAVAHTTSKSPIYQYTDFENVYGTAAFLAVLKSECPNMPDVQAEEGMKFVILSTCEVSRKDGRALVIGMTKEETHDISGT